MCLFAELSFLGRNHTLQRVLANVFLEGAEEELSYRIIVRDLKLKSPMLLLVLLNSKAWISSGYCSEDSMGSLSAADLQPVLKVLYSDCSIASEANSRYIIPCSILIVLSYHLHLY